MGLFGNGKSDKHTARRTEATTRKREAGAEKKDLKNKKLKASIDRKEAKNEVFKSRGGHGFVMFNEGAKTKPNAGVKKTSKPMAKPKTLGKKAEANKRSYNKTETKPKTKKTKAAPASKTAGAKPNTKVRSGNYNTSNISWQYDLDRGSERGFKGLKILKKTEYKKEEPIYEIDHESASKVIDLYNTKESPIGRFLIREEGGGYTAIDNSSSNAFTEHFDTRQKAVRWLHGKFEVFDD